MDLFITLVLGFIIFYCLYKLSTKDRSYWKDRGIPEVKSLPFFGNNLETILMKKRFSLVVCELYHELKGLRFGGLFQLQKPTLLIRDPELINHVLIKDFVHFQDNGFYMDEKNEPLSCGLTNLSGNRWRVLRHKLMPAFTSGKLKMMFVQINKCSDDTLKVIRNLKSYQEVELRNIVQKFNLNVVGTVSFGLNVNAFEDENEESKMFFEHACKYFTPSWRQVLKNMLKKTAPGLYSLLKLKLIDKDVEIFFTKLVKDTIQYREETGFRRNDFLQLMIDLRKKELSDPNYFAKTNNNNNDKSDFGDEDQVLLEQLRNTPHEENGEIKEIIFTDNIIASQAFEFISGGSETTTGVLSLAFYHMAANPKTQTLLQEEIDNILANQDYDYNSVREMTYMDQFLHEVMRLHPPAGALRRICTEDYHIPGSDKVIEKGVRIIVPVLAIHKDSQYYPDPETFNPDRFKDMKVIPKGAYFPFGGGPRICIAMRLAMLEMKIFISRILMEYNVILGEKTQLPLKLCSNSIAQHIVGGLWVKFERRL